MRRWTRRSARIEQPTRIVLVLLTATLGVNGACHGARPRHAEPPGDSHGMNHVGSGGQPGSVNQSQSGLGQQDSNDHTTAPRQAGGQQTSPTTRPGQPARSTGARPGQTGGSAPARTHSPVQLTSMFQVTLPAGTQPTAAAAHKGVVAVATKAKTVLLLDGHSGKTLWTSQPLDQVIDALTFSADASRLAGVGDQLTSFVWDLAPKYAIYRTWHRKAGHDQVLSPDGHRLVRVDVRHSIRWFELATYKMKWLVKATLLGASKDGSIVLCLDRKGNLSMRSAVTGRSVRMVRLGPDVVRATLDKTSNRLLVLRKSGAGFQVEVRDAKGHDLGKKIMLPGEPLGLTLLSQGQAVAWGAFGVAFLDLDKAVIATKRPDIKGFISISDKTLYVVGRHGKIAGLRIDWPKTNRPQPGGSSDAR
ncbi:MAG: hypothetical protein J7M25_04805 [Deltaproteobacteria bacterium]|nr:hypothetical protein [Deltaproteobacteria bacterium]